MDIGLRTVRPHPVKGLLEGVHHLLRLDGDGVARDLPSIEEGVEMGYAVGLAG